MSDRCRSRGSRCTAAAFLAWPSSASGAPPPRPAVRPRRSRIVVRLRTWVVLVRPTHSMKWVNRIILYPYASGKDFPRNSCMAELDSYLETHRGKFEADLCELLRIPS